MLTAGTRLKAETANLFQPTEHFAACSSDLAASSTDVDIVGATITLTTQTNGARYLVTAVVYARLIGATTAAVRGKLVIDNFVQAAESVAEAEVTTDGSTVRQMWSGALAIKGTHTIKLRGTTPANANIKATHTNLVVKISEVF